MSIPELYGFQAKLILLQKQCELLEQLMLEHELKSPVHVMNDCLAQINLELGAVNRMMGFKPPLFGASPAMEALGLIEQEQNSPCDLRPGALNSVMCRMVNGIIMLDE